MRQHLKSFAMLRKKIAQVENNLAKGITMDSFVEQNVEKYAEDFPSLGGAPVEEVKDEFDENKKSYREKDKE